jgi:hypothetical protein
MKASDSKNRGKPAKLKKNRVKRAIRAENRGSYAIGPLLFICKLEFLTHVCNNIIYYLILLSSSI